MPASVPQPAPLWIRPANPSFAVVWLHGFASTPERQAEELMSLQKQRPWAWLHLRARALPQTCLNGEARTAWGDFTSAERVTVGSADFESTDNHRW